MAFSKEKAHEKAERFAARGQHDRAAREYQAIVENDPRDIRAWLMLADCLVRSGDRAGAIDRYLQIAGYYTAQRQAQKALAVYRQVVNLDPHRVDVHQKIAEINLELGRVQDAVTIYEQIGNVQLQRGATEEAIATFETVVSADPTAVPKRLRLAELHSRAHNVDRAVEHFRIAGEQLLNMGRKDEFVRVGERLLYHQADDESTIRLLARVYLERADPRRALMKLNSLLQIDSHDREGLELLAETFVALDKRDKAISVALELARELRSVGAQAEMLRVARRALDWDPGNVDLLSILGGPSGVSAGRRGGDGGHSKTGTSARHVGPAEEEIEELDDEDLISADSRTMQLPFEAIAAAAGVATGRSRPPSPQPVVEPSRSEAVILSGEPGIIEETASGTLDLDKILLEARVYIKYRLFDHAVTHLRELLALEPSHPSALALRARAFTELGKAQEAAADHVHVAQEVVASDPKLAREHIAAALKVSPGYAAALSLQEEVQGLSAGASGSAPVAVETPLEASDSGTFELVTDDIIHESGEALVDDEPDESGAMPAFEFAHSDVENGQGDESDVDLTTYDEPTPPYGLEDVPAAQAAQGPDEGLLSRPFVGDEHSLELGVDLAFEGLVDDDHVPAPEENSRDDVMPDMGHREVGVANSPSTPDKNDRTAWPDISDEVAEVRFFLDQGLDEDAAFSLQELERRYPGHPDVEALRGVEQAAAAVDVGSGAQPLVNLSSENEDEDAFLTALFGEPTTSTASKTKGVAIRAPDVVQAGDAATSYDLGMAYQDMGLVDNAIAQFEIAARDPAWRARAWVMLGTLRGLRGESQQAISDLVAAIEAAQTNDEMCAARYELGLLYQRLGEVDLAIEQLAAVTPGYRDRDTRLVDLAS